MQSVWAMWKFYINITFWYFLFKRCLFCTGDFHFFLIFHLCIPDIWFLPNRWRVANFKIPGQKQALFHLRNLSRVSFIWNDWYSVLIYSRFQAVVDIYTWWTTMAVTYCPARGKQIGECWWLNTHTWIQCRPVQIHLIAHCNKLC